MGKPGICICANSHRELVKRVYLAKRGILPRELYLDIKIA